MKNLPRKLALIAAVATADTDSFVTLAQRAGLDPAIAFRGADLRGVDFGTDNLAGYNFSHASLHGANFERVQKLDEAILESATWDETTRWPKHGLSGSPKSSTPNKINKKLIIDEIIYSLENDIEIPKYQLMEITSLDLSYTRVTNLHQLIYCINLRSLDISYTKISDLSPINKNPSLITFNARRTNISHFPHRFSIKTLAYLSLTGSPVQDLKNINLPSLLILDVGYTKISSIKPALNMKKLSSLDISFTKINNIESLLLHPNLSELDVTGLPEGIEDKIERFSEVVVTRHATEISERDII